MCVSDKHKTPLFVLNADFATFVPAILARPASIPFHGLCSGRKHLDFDATTAGDDALNEVGAGVRLKDALVVFVRLSDSLTQNHTPDTFHLGD
jgi:hypothetical protein